MQENEKFGIELEAKVSKFKSVMKSTANYVKTLAQDMKDAITLNPQSDLYRGMNRNELQKELEAQKEIMRQAKENMRLKNVDTTSPFYTKSRSAYAEASVRASLLRNRLKEVEDVVEETDEQTKKTDNGLADMFKKGISNIKRFSFYLLGARSVFTLFMKYQGIYYQYNEQMQYQSELSQNAIALSLAPAFKVLGDAISYVSIGFALFIEMLTGVNVLSKVTTKGIRDYNKSLKETQTLLSGIDEITNLTTPQTMGLMGQYEALDEFRKMVDDVREKFNKWHVDEFIEGLKNLWNWLTENKQALLYLGTSLALTFGIVKMGMWVANIGTLTTSVSTATSKTSALKLGLSSLAKIGAIAIGVSVVVSGLSKLKQMNDELGELIKYESLLSGESEASLKKKYKNQFWQNVSGYALSLFSPSGTFKTESGKVYERGDIWDAIASMFGFAKGLDYVPYDEMPAILHKGEAVVPAKYNPTIHSQGNEYTNSLLETLVLKIDDLANRPNVFEIDGKSFANATFPLYQETRKNQGYMPNVVVR